MKKIIYQKYDKSLIGELPRVSFNGRIVVVLSEQEANRAVEYLLSRPILGFDTETRPSFRRGHVNEVALMQVSDERICFLFRLNLIGMLPCVVRLLYLLPHEQHDLLTYHLRHKDLLGLIRELVIREKVRTLLGVSSYLRL